MSSNTLCESWGVHTRTLERDKIFINLVINKNFTWYNNHEVIPTHYVIRYKNRKVKNEGEEAKTNTTGNSGRRGSPLEVKEVRYVTGWFLG